MRQRDNTANNPKVTVKAKIDFRNYTGIITNVCVLAKQVGTEASLGNINPTNVTVTYQAAEHLFRVAGKTPGQVSLARSNEWEWVVTHVNEVELKKPFPFCTSGVHRVYTIFDEPKAPWSNTYGSPQNAWVTALDFAILTNNCNGANSTHTALANITSYLHSGHGLTYDTVSGRLQFGVHGLVGGTFDLTGYMTKQPSNPVQGMNNNVVNCYDQAAAVCIIGRLLGVSVAYRYMEPFGYINTVDLVGVGLCNHPFYLYPIQGNSGLMITGADEVMPKRFPFSNHAFTTSNSKVFDACAGPALGTQTEAEYVSTAIDTSTANEAAEAGTVMGIRTTTINGIK